MAKFKDTVQATVEVDGKQAINELGKMEYKQKELLASLKEMRKSVKEYEKQTARLDKLKVGRDAFLSAKKEAEALTKAIADAESEMQKANKGSDAYKAAAQKVKELKTELRETNKEIKRNARSAADFDDAAKKVEALRGSVGKYKQTLEQANEAGLKIRNYRKELNVTELTVSQLTKSQRELNRELSFQKIGTEKYNELATRLKDVNTQLDKHRSNLRASQKEWKSSANGLSNMSVFLGNTFANIAMMFATTVLSGIKEGFSAMLNIAATSSDELADIQKATNMTTAEVETLDAALRKIDTRTSVSELRNIAVVAGQLGIAKSEVEGFVESVDRAVVALGDEFEGGAETVARELGSLQTLFKETKEAAPSEAISRIGSAINALGAAGKIRAPELAEFTKRLGQLGDIAPGINDTLGLGATLVGELGLSADIAASGLSNILLNAGTNAEAFAKQMQMPTEEFKNLLNTDPNAMLIKLAESLKGLPTTEVAETMKTLKLGTQESIKVVNSLAANTDLLREKQALSALEFEKNTSIVEEFNLKNSNFAAQLAKVQKQVTEVAMQITSFFTPALSEALSITSSFIDMLMGDPFAAFGDSAQKVFAKSGDKMQGFYTDFPNQIGLIKTLTDDLGISTEQAGQGLSEVFNSLTNNTDALLDNIVLYKEETSFNFADPFNPLVSVMQMSREEVQKLKAENPAEFFEQFAATLKGLSPEEVKDYFKTLGIEGEAAAQIMSQLGDNIELLNENQKEAQKEVDKWQPFIAVFNEIKEVFEEVISEVSAIISELFSLQKEGETAATAIDLFAAALRFIITPLLNFLRRVTQIAKAFKTAWNESENFRKAVLFVIDSIELKLKIFAQGITNIFSGVSEALVGLTNLDFSKVQSGLKQIADGIGQAAIEVFVRTADIRTDTGDGIKAAKKDEPSAAVSDTKTAASEVVDIAAEQAKLQSTLDALKGISAEQRTAMQNQIDFFAVSTDEQRKATQASLAELQSTNETTKKTTRTEIQTTAAASKALRDESQKMIEEWDKFRAGIDKIQSEIALDLLTPQQREIQKIADKYSELEKAATDAFEAARAHDKTITAESLKAELVRISELRKTEVKKVWEAFKAETAAGENAQGELGAVDAIYAKYTELETQTKAAFEAARAQDASLTYKELETQLQSLAAQMQAELDTRRESVEKAINAETQTKFDAQIIQIEEHYSKLIEQASAHGLETIELEKLKGMAIAAVQEEALAQEVKATEDAINHKIAMREAEAQKQAQLAGAVGQIMTDANNLVGGQSSMLLAFEKIAAIAKIKIETASAVSTAITKATASSATPIDMAINIALAVGSVLSAISQAKNIIDRTQTPSAPTFAAPEAPKLRRGGFILRGRSHAAGGIQIMDGENQIAEAEGGEGFMVLSREDRAKMPLINSILDAPVPPPNFTGMRDSVRSERQAAASPDFSQLENMLGRQAEQNKELLNIIAGMPKSLKSYIVYSDIEETQNKIDKIKNYK